MAGPWRPERDHLGGWKGRCRCLGKSVPKAQRMEQLGLAGGQLSARSPQANDTYSPKDSWLPGFNLTRKKGQGRTEVISYRFTDAENKAQTLPTLGQLTVIMTVTAAAVSWWSVL